jgi:hypothetical protein
MDVHVLGIDLGKNSCSVVGLDATGRVTTRRRMRRESIVALAAKLPGCVIAMEACCGAHHLGRHHERHLGLIVLAIFAGMFAWLLERMLVANLRR